MPKLTKPMIDRTQTAGTDLLLWDSALPGFGLRVKPTGIKSFVLQYRTRERISRRMTIGRYGTLTLDHARKEARRLLGEVSLGKDPARERADAGNGPTVFELGLRYICEHCEGRCKASTLVQYEWLLKKFIRPELGSHMLKALAREDVERLHQKLAATPYNANRVLGLLKTMLNYAEHWGWREPDSNPARLIRKYKERKKQRYLSAEELERLHATIAKAEATGEITPHVAAAFRLLILTGCRLNEILTLRWTAEIDLPNRRLLLARHKADGKGIKAIPLSQPAMELLSRLERVDGNPYTIVGTGENKHLVNLQKPWRKLRARAALSDVRIHDLRHSFASIAAAAGMSLPVIGALLGHTDQQSTARYAHLAQEPIRAASEVVGGVLAPFMRLRR